MAWASKHNLSFESLDEFTFVRPKEAPVYRPSKEEFVDPLEFINKIRPEAEAFGICKIIPPPDWHPPFAVDIEQFRFTPRIQKINELEAHTRVKLNFLDQIAKFWELQGSPLKLPLIEKRILDVYTLHQLVQREGGASQVTQNKKWSNIASMMGLSKENRANASSLKTHYEKILMPYDIFLSVQGPNGQPKEEDVKPDSNKISECSDIMTSSKSSKRPIQDVNSGSSDDDSGKELDTSGRKRVSLRNSCSSNVSYSRRRSERDKLKAAAAKPVSKVTEEVTADDPFETIVDEDIKDACSNFLKRYSTDVSEEMFEELIHLK